MLGRLLPLAFIFIAGCSSSLAGSGSSGFNRPARHYSTQLLSEYEAINNQALMAALNFDLQMILLLSRTSLTSYPTFVILRTDRPLAYSDQEFRIVLSSGLLKSLDSAPQLLFILAHEVGHLRLHASVEQLSEREERVIAEEIEADDFALSVLRKVALEAHLNAALLTRLYLPTKDSSKPEADPPGMVELEARQRNIVAWQQRWLHQPQVLSWQNLSAQRVIRANFKELQRALVQKSFGADQVSG